MYFTPIRWEVLTNRAMACDYSIEDEIAEVMNMSVWMDRVSYNNI